MGSDVDFFTFDSNNPLNSWFITDEKNTFFIGIEPCEDKNGLLTGFVKSTLEKCHGETNLIDPDTN